MKLLKFNVFLSTFVLVLILVGYPLITTLLLPASGDVSDVSQSVTVPYRIFCLGIMILVIIMNIKTHIGKLPVPFIILVCFWIFWILRMVYDLLIRNDVFIESTSQLWLYVIGICVPAIVCIRKSVNLIDPDKALKWSWWGLTIVLLVTLFSNQALINNTDNEYRVDGNIALNTISYGNIGVTTFVLSFFLILKKKLYSKWEYAICLLVCFLAIYSVLRAGSRGPLLNLIFLLVFWFYASRKNKMGGTIAVFGILTILFIFNNFFISLLGEISPVIEYRLRDTIEGTAGDGRNVLHQAAINSFIDSPFIGQQFAIFDKAGGYAYAHNIFLDALMGLGIIGGLMVIFIIISAVRAIFVSIRDNENYYWIGIILLQQIFSLMLSGAFYQDQIFCGLLTFILLKQKNIFIPWK